MSIRTRVIALLILIAVLPLGLFGLTAYRVSTTNLLDVEKSNLDRALDSVNRAITQLQNNQTKPTTDWSNYDDLHDQVAKGTPDPDWIKTNLDPTVDKSAGNTYNLDIVGLWNKDQQSLYSYGPTVDSAKILKTTMDGSFQSTTPITQLIGLNGDVYIISIASVRTSAGNDPNGILMFGSKIGKTDIQEIKDLTGYDVALYKDLQPITAGEVTTVTPNPDVLQSAASAKNAQNFYQQTDSNTALALKPLADFSGANIATIVVSSPREATSAAQNSITSVLAIFFVLGLLLAGIVAALLTQSILPQMTDIVRAANKFAEGDMTARAAIRSHDELGTVGRAFNDMANRLTERVQSTQEENFRLQEIDVYRLNLLTEITQALRTPLTTIKSNVETLSQLQYGSLNEPQVRLVDGIRRASAQEETLLTDLLDFSKAQRNQLQILRERISIPDLLRETSTAVKERFKAKPIQLNMALSNDLPTIMADRVRMEQIFDSLFAWAIDFSIVGGEVRVNASIQDRFLQIRVSDSSKGLSSEERTKIFDLFYHPNGNGHATNGLGLAFVKALVEQQGGSIAVESEPGQGNTFTVSLPA
jgi:signal transduction histidine kinase